MTMNKVLLSVLVAVTVVLVPVICVSKDTNPDTIVLNKKNTLVLNGEVNGDSVGAIILKAKEMDVSLAGKLLLKKGEPIYLYISSPGGSVMSGLELIEALKGLGRPVHTVTAFGASMAFQIAQNLNTRFILQSGTLMSHRAAGQFEGSFGGASPSQLEQRIGYFTQVTREMDEQTVARTNGKQTLESYQKSYASELWLTGSQAVAGGYADAITKVKCDNSLAGTTKHETNFMGMPVSYELDNCPINSAPLNIQIGAKFGASQEYLNSVKTQFLSSFGNKASTPLPLVL